MKKLLSKMIIISGTLLLVSCGTLKQQSVNISAKEKSVEATDQSTGSGTYTILNSAYTNSDRNSHIVIKYPTLQGKGFEQSNKLIENNIRKYISEMYGSDYSDLDLALDYNISFQNQSIISIVFKGLGNVKTAAHPNHNFFTLNIDVKNGNQIKLFDIYTISDNFKKIYFEAAKKQNPDMVSIVEDLRTVDLHSTERKFKLADSFDAVQSYLTPDGLGLSMPVAFALGNHFETVIPYNKITPYLKSKKSIDMPPGN
jgi:hypothetical protein